MYIPQLARRLNFKHTTFRFQLQMQVFLHGYLALIQFYVKLQN